MAQGCSHGDGDDDLSGVMPEHNDDDGRVHEPVLGACHGGADLAPAHVDGATRSSASNTAIGTFMASMATLQQEKLVLTGFPCLRLLACCVSW